MPVYILGLEGFWKKGFLILVLNIREIWFKSGPKFTSQYLSECSRALICWAGNEKFIQGKTLISITNSGLPKIIPIYLRKQISGLKLGSDSSKLVFRAVLTGLSVYRVIGFSPIFKWETITDPFTGSTQTLPEMELSRVIKLIRPIKHLKKPDFTEISESSGPNYPRATWSSALDAFALALHPKQALSFIKWCRHYRWDLPIVWWLMILGLTMPLLLLVKALQMVTFQRYDLFPSGTLCIGRLATVLEARGKVRIVAIVDYWTQLVLKPLHHSIFKTLRRIPQDGTFDQVSPMKELLNRVSISGERIASFDLSAATDRLPAALQVQILNLMGVPGDLWISLLHRDYVYRGKDGEGENVSRVLNYAVGQPMGAYSSWGMLAITHHIIVQIAAGRVGFSNSWFRDYAVLGDDVIIAHELVAQSYKSLMNDLGVEINMTKSHHGNVAEFAKRWIHPHYGELTPVGAGNILTVVRNIRLMPNLVMDLSMKGYPYLWNMVQRAVSQMPSKNLNDHFVALACTLFCLGPSGILLSGTQRPAEWLGSWASKYYGGTVNLPNLLNAILFARQCDRHSEIEQENARNREARERVLALWTMWPLTSYIFNNRKWCHYPPNAKTLGWLLGLSQDTNDLGRPVNPFAQWRLPWSFRINWQRLFWAGVQRISPGFHAYSLEKEVLHTFVLRSSWENELKRSRNITKWAQSRGQEDMDDLIQTGINRLSRPLDDLESVVSTDIDWNREILSSDYVNRTLSIYARVMELLHPPTPDLDKSLSLTVYQHSSADDELISNGVTTMSEVIGDAHSQNTVILPEKRKTIIYL